jgi:membrane-bound metal-dependent hydrolase YbcI (DUF457 family)
MIVGHGLLAFAIAAALAGRYVAPDRALSLGAIAAAFAVIPDVDVAYGLIGVLGAIASSGDVVESFWTAGLVAHRGLTHSLPVGTVLALALGLFTATDRRWAPPAGGALLVGILALGTLGGLLAAITTGVFVVLGVAIARIGARRFDLAPTAVGGLAAVGLLSHPVGDLFTGTPPALLYPLTTVRPERIALAADPTLHLLGTFGLELLAAWLAILVLAEFRGHAIGDAVALRALAGGTFGVAAVVLTPPTLEAPYRFTASVLPIAAGVGASCWVRPPVCWDRPSAVTTATTAIAALSLALLAYTIVYLAL